MPHSLYAEAADTVVEALGADVEQAVAEHGALFISSNTLVWPPPSVRSPCAPVRPP